MATNNSYDRTIQRDIQIFFIRHQEDRIVKQSMHCWVNANTSLLDLLREHFQLTGPKEACGVGECGACAVLLNGQVVRSCLILAFECDGAEIMTIEGMACGKNLHTLQQSFIQHDAVQCGYCTPGFLIAAYQLYQRTPHPSEEEIWEAMGGHLCRCTGYQSIFHAIQNHQTLLPANNKSNTEKV